MAMLEIDNLEFSYGGGGGTVLNGLSISVAKGELVGIIGPNGAGKSTLLKLMSGYLNPTGGRVDFDGADVASMPRGKRAELIGVVPQNVFTPMPYTSRQIVEMGRATKVSRFLPLSDEDHAAVDAALRDMDASNLADRPFNALSGGERQRVVLAAAISKNPALLFLDEPTSQLDIGHSIGFTKLVVELRERTGATVVIVSHDVQLMSCFLPRMVVLKDGGVFADGPTGNVVTTEMMRGVYGCAVEVRKRSGGGVALLPET